MKRAVNGEPVYVPLQPDCKRNERALGKLTIGESHVPSVGFGKITHVDAKCYWIKTPDVAGKKVPKELHSEGMQLLEGDHVKLLYTLEQQNLVRIGFVYILEL